MYGSRCVLTAKKAGFTPKRTSPPSAYPPSDRAYAEAVFRARRGFSASLDHADFCPACSRGVPRYLRCTTDRLRPKSGTTSLQLSRSFPLTLLGAAGDFRGDDFRGLVVWVGASSARGCTKWGRRLPPQFCASRASTLPALADSVSLFGRPYRTPSPS